LASVAGILSALPAIGDAWAHFVAKWLPADCITQNMPAVSHFGNKTSGANVNTILRLQHSPRRASKLAFPGNEAWMSWNFPQRGKKQISPSATTKTEAGRAFPYMITEYLLSESFVKQA